MPLKVTLSKEVTVKGGCLLDMTYYPFDSQTCHLSFGSWSRGLDSLDLTLASNNITTSYQSARSSGEKLQNPKQSNIISHRTCFGLYLIDLDQNYYPCMIFRDNGSDEFQSSKRNAERELCRRAGGNSKYCTKAF